MTRDATDEEFDWIIAQHAETRPDDPDYEALDACCRPLALIRVGDVPVPVVEPLAPCEDNMDFDRAVCAAGVKRFVRRSMPSDAPGSGRPLDPTIPVPQVNPGDWLIVLEIQEGLRVKQTIRVAWLKDPHEEATSP
jgi:hypothetical protein